jgi:hypothetical protein
MSVARGEKEASVLRAVDHWLTAKGIAHWRINSGALKTEGGRFVRFGARGMADIYAIGQEGKSIWIECKRSEGGVVSDAQREFLECVAANGGIGIVVSSVESLERQLKGYGVV